jgi:hypothetical protein
MPHRERSFLINLSRRGPVRNAATRWRYARYQRLQIGIHSAKQRSKVGVLPKESMKASAHRDLIITMGHMPGTHPIIELLVRSIMISVHRVRPVQQLPRCQQYHRRRRRPVWMGWSGSRDEAGPE